MRPRKEKGLDQGHRRPKPGFITSARCSSPDIRHLEDFCAKVGAHEVTVTVDWSAWEAAHHLQPVGFPFCVVCSSFGNQIN